MTEAQTYTLSSLRDVYEQVPADRILDCLRELGQLMLLYRGVGGVVDYVAQSEGVQLEPTVWPDAVTWVDDGKGELTVNLTADGVETMAFRIEKEAE